MKLTCEAVEDLYVLYQEGELHDSVKKAVDEHLDTCGNCRLLYETGDNFLKTKEAKVGDESLTPSSKLDQQIKMKLKLRRLQVAFLFFISVFIIYTFFQYLDDRRSLLYEISSLEETVRDLYFQLDRVKTEGDAHFTTSSLITDLNEKTARIKRNLNFYEKRQLEDYPYQLHLNFELSHFLSVLHTRYQNGYWTDRDEEALSRMNEYFDAITRLLTDERLKLNHVEQYHPSALFKPFKGEELEELHHQINQLAYTYGHFQQFPEEVGVLSQEELTERVQYVFREPTAEITYVLPNKPEIAEGFGSYSTNIESEDREYYAEWEAYTGRLISFHRSQLAQTGELLKEEEVLRLLDEYVPRLIGVETYRFESLGINYHYSSNVDNQLYTYKIIPVKDGYDTDASYRLYIDGRTGELAGWMATDKPYYSNLSFSGSEIEVSKEEGKSKLEKTYPNVEFTYEDTLYIPSIVKNQYVLVHLYEGMGDGEYTTKYLVNARTGEEEVTF